MHTPVEMEDAVLWNVVEIELRDCAGPHGDDWAVIEERVSAGMRCELICRERLSRRRGDSGYSRR